MLSISDFGTHYIYSNPMTFVEMGNVILSTVNSLDNYYQRLRCNHRNFSMHRDYYKHKQ